MYFISFFLAEGLKENKNKLNSLKEKKKKKKKKYFHFNVFYFFFVSLHVMFGGEVLFGFSSFFVAD
jgi:hypothetical protein